MYLCFIAPQLFHLSTAAIFIPFSHLIVMFRAQVKDIPPLPPLVQATPMFKHHQVLALSTFAPWVLAVHFFFYIGASVCCVMSIICLGEAYLATIAFVAFFYP